MQGLEKREKHIFMLVHMFSINTIITKLNYYSYCKFIIKLKGTQCY